MQRRRSVSLVFASRKHGHAIRAALDFGDREKVTVTSAAGVQIEIVFGETRVGAKAGNETVGIDRFQRHAEDLSEVQPVDKDLRADHTRVGGGNGSAHAENARQYRSIRGNQLELRRADRLAARRDDANRTGIRIEWHRDVQQRVRKNLEDCGRFVE